jgi:hypothetical protein
MTFLSRRLSATRLSCALAVLALATLSTAGCENKHIGRPCDLGISDDGGAPPGGTTSTINPEALECPSRICLLPPNQTNVNVKSLCTDFCSSDDDCSDGETGSMSSMLCTQGFACVVATTVGDFCCRSMCVCKDFILDLKTARNKPAACLPGSGNTCKNVSQ